MSDEVLLGLLALTIAATGAGILYCVDRRWRFTPPENHPVLVACAVLGVVMILVGSGLFAYPRLQ